ncbi:alpha-L-fucosidase [Paragonimus westermani]|uniref:alpha-L-fucosidase n=1 Tax=Paragonimus westermani TaxID=34504 RepID=A0A5J4N7C3_9TREM|nr:alpha-L-fucosidase [Paragonimus westermani]
MTHPKDYINKKMLPELKDLVLRYQPEIVWSDGDAGPDSYWTSTEFLAWLYNESPELVYEVVSTVAFGGNILINVGPTAWGTISPIYEERLRQLGSWLRINGEAIYATTPWRVQNDSDHIWFTSKVHPMRFPLETLVNEDKATDRPSKTEDVPFYARLASPTTVYAIVTQWTNEPFVDESTRCSASVYLPSIRANLQRSEFYLLNGTQSTGIKLFFQPEPHGRPGVRVMLPDTPTNAVQIQWGCAIKMLNVA